MPSIQAFMMQLVNEYEGEVNYTPLVVQWPSDVPYNDEAYQALEAFLKAPRKRLFVITLPEAHQAKNSQLYWLAKRHVLAHLANTFLDKAQQAPKIHPTKQAWLDQQVRRPPAIQVQRVYKPNAAVATPSQPPRPRRLSAPAARPNQPPPQNPTDQDMQTFSGAATGLETPVVTDGFVLNKTPLYLAFDAKHQKALTALCACFKEIADQVALINLIRQSFLTGGESHAMYLIKTLQAFHDQKRPIQYFITPKVAESLLLPKGLSSLEKLRQLPEDQRQWWDKFIELEGKKQPPAFDLEAFFDAFTLRFLPALAEKGLHRLPTPCPITSMGALPFCDLLTRIQTVITRAANPQEQCASLTGLTWETPGAYEAMSAHGFQQVHAEMALNSDEAFNLPTLSDVDISEAIGFRWIGKHWKSGISFEVIKQVKKTAEASCHPMSADDKTALWTIIVSTFPDPSVKTAEDWKSKVTALCARLQEQPSTVRKELLIVLKSCKAWRPAPTLAQCGRCLDWIANASEAGKAAFITNLPSFLKADGFLAAEQLHLRLKKLNKLPDIQACLERVVATVASNEAFQKAPWLLVLSYLSDDDLSQAPQLLQSIQEKGLGGELLLARLATFNVEKSSEFFSTQTLIKLLQTIPSPLPPPDGQAWFNHWWVTQKALPACVFGPGDLSAESLWAKLKEIASVSLKRFNAMKLQSSSTKTLRELARDQINSQVDEKETVLPIYDEAMRALTTLEKTLENPDTTLPIVSKDLGAVDQVFRKLSKQSLTIRLMGFPFNYTAQEWLSMLWESTCTGVLALLNWAKPWIEAYVKESVKKDFFSQDTPKSKAKETEETEQLEQLTKQRLNSIGLAIKHFSIIALLKQTICSKISAEFNRKLQTMALPADLSEAVLTELREISVEIPAKEALEAYYHKITKLLKYLEQLQTLKQTDDRTYQEILVLLRTPALKKQPLEVMATLLATGITHRLDLKNFLKLTADTLADKPHCLNSSVIETLVSVFNLPNISSEMRNSFFEMGLTHYATQPETPFPLNALIVLKTQLHFSGTPEAQNLKKETVFQWVMDILAQGVMKDAKEIQAFVQGTQHALEDEMFYPLGVALMRRCVAEGTPTAMKEYMKILGLLKDLKTEERRLIQPMLQGLAENIKDKTCSLSILHAIASGLKSRDKKLAKLQQALFTFPPYPPAGTLATYLAPHDDEDLDAYCNTFDLNPFAQLDRSRDLAAQFKADRIAEMISQTQDLLAQSPLSREMQLQFATYFAYMGGIGDERAGVSGLAEGFTKWPRVKLKERILELGARLRPDQPEMTSQAQCELLALLRELYFRSTGLFPRPTQMLSLLLAWRYPGNLLMEMQTGEGKSVVMPLLAILEHFKGGTVDICTANRQLLARDYAKNYEPLFKALGVNSCLIGEASPSDAYCRGGINCATLEDLIFLRLQAKENHETAKVEDPTRKSLLLDECDDVLLDKKMLYRLVSQETSIGMEAWVCPLVQAFIMKQNDEASKQRSEEEDVARLAAYLKAQAQTAEDSEAKLTRLTQTTQTHLVTWLRAAYEANTYVEDKHFTRHKKPDHTFVALPQKGCVFTSEVQQALQARLAMQYQSAGQIFNIESAPSVVASQSARSMLASYHQEDDRIVGLSGTLGNVPELALLEKTDGIRAISLPLYAGETRRVFPSVFVRNDKELIDAVHQAIDQVKSPTTAYQGPAIDNPDRKRSEEETQAYAEAETKALYNWRQTQTQPILILCETLKEARALHKTMAAYEKNKAYTVQLIEGTESPDKQDALLDQAGKVRTITIAASPSVARGVDIDYGEHRKGLHVIQTHVDTTRMTRQIAGRTARNEKPGSYVAIYQTPTPRSFWGKVAYTLFPWVRARYDQEAVGTCQQILHKRAAVERRYTEAVNRVEQILMAQVDQWETLLTEITPHNTALSAQLLAWRGQLFSDLKKCQMTEVSLEDDVEKSIADFHTLICLHFKAFRNNAWITYCEQPQSPLSDTQTTTLTILKMLDLEKALAMPDPLSEVAAVKAGVDALGHQTLQCTVADQAGARLAFIEQELAGKTPAAANELLKQAAPELKATSAKQVLPYLIGDYAALSPQALKRFYENIPSSERAFWANDAQKLQKVRAYYVTYCSASSPEKIKELIQMTGTLLSEESSPGTLPGGVTTQLQFFGVIREFISCMAHADVTLSGDPTPNANEPATKPLEKGAQTKFGELEKKYGDHVFYKLITYLRTELAWSATDPKCWHAYLERDAVSAAAKDIYAAVNGEIQAGTWDKKIQEVYVALQRHQVALENKWLLSVGHTCPRRVIQVALEAIASLKDRSCDEAYQQKIHDAVRMERYYKAFQKSLKALGDAPEAWKDKIKALKTAYPPDCAIERYTPSFLINLQKELASLLKKPPSAEGQAKKPCDVFRHKLEALTKKYDHALDKLKRPGHLKSAFDREIPAAEPRQRAPSGLAGGARFFQAQTSEKTTTVVTQARQKLQDEERALKDLTPQLTQKAILEDAVLSRLPAQIQLDYKALAQWNAFQKTQNWTIAGLPEGTNTLPQEVQHAITHWSYLCKACTDPTTLKDADKAANRTRWEKTDDGKALLETQTKLAELEKKLPGIRLYELQSLQKLTPEQMQEKAELEDQKVRPQTPFPPLVFQTPTEWATEKRANKETVKKKVEQQEALYSLWLKSTLQTYTNTAEEAAKTKLDEYLATRNIPKEISVILATKKVELDRLAEQTGTLPETPKV